LGERYSFSHGPIERTVTFSQDGKVLATDGADAAAYLWDVYGNQTRAEPKPDAAALEKAWSGLASRDAGAGFRAVRTLAAAPVEAVALLRDQLKEEAGPDAMTLRQWLADLDSPVFATREKATTALTAALGRVEPALRKALEEATALEVRRRLEAILAHAGEPTPEVLRARRGVEVLEVVGTAESRRLLGDLAGGSANHRLTVEAKAAVDRARAKR
jgi:hypothetical protein